MSTAKQRYDAKRRNDPDRRVREWHRSLCRSFVKKGLCKRCDHVGATVWHHETYAGSASCLMELCYRCHRKAHPRRMPNGKVV